MDIDTLTLGDIEDIENYAGLSFSDIGEDKPGVSKLRTALVWVLKRKENKKFTIEDARNITPDELSKIFEETPLKK
jgi:hypothetical protein